MAEQRDPLSLRSRVRAVAGVWLANIAARTLAYWLPERWRARLDLAKRRVVRQQLRWAPQHALLLFGIFTIGARIRAADKRRRARLRAELGREPSEEEVEAARLKEHGIDPAACPVPRHDV